MLGACCSKNRFFEAQEGTEDHDFLTALKSLLGTILGRVEGPKSIQNRSIINFKKEDAKTTKMSKKKKTFSFSMIFEVPGVGKSIQKSIFEISEAPLP